MFLIRSVFPRKSPDKDNAKYMASCITILLINIPYFISVTSIVLVMWVLPNQISFHEIIFAWIPILTSGINPIIILTRTSDVRDGVFRNLRRCARWKYKTDQVYSDSISTQDTKTGRKIQLSFVGALPDSVFSNKTVCDPIA